MLDLHHEPLDQANIASSNAKKSRHCFLVCKIVLMDLHPVAPTLAKKEARLLRQRVDLIK